MIAHRFWVGVNTNYHITCLLLTSIFQIELTNGVQLTLEIWPCVKVMTHPLVKNQLKVIYNGLDMNLCSLWPWPQDMTLIQTFFLQLYFLQYVTSSWPEHHPIRCHSMVQVTNVILFGMIWQKLPSICILQGLVLCYYCIQLWISPVIFSPYENLRLIRSVLNLPTLQSSPT